MAGTGNDKQTITRVSEEIVSMIAARAALRVSGVSRLNGEFTDNLTKKIFGTEESFSPEKKKGLASIFI